jgi:hypothetical protein
MVVERKLPQPLAGFEPPIVQPIVQCYTTELCWLLLIIHYRVKTVGMHEIMFACTT